MTGSPLESHRVVSAAVLCCLSISDLSVVGRTLPVCWIVSDVATRMIPGAAITRHMYLCPQPESVWVDDMDDLGRAHRARMVSLAALGFPARRFGWGRLGRGLWARLLGVLVKVRTSWVDEVGIEEVRVRVFDLLLLRCFGRRGGLYNGHPPGYR